MKLGDLFIKLGLQKEGFDKGLNDAKNKTTGFGNAMKKVGGMVAGIFAVGAITGFISNIIKVRSEFERYEAVLTNTLGSNKQARIEMEMLQKFAAETPFALTELTGGFVKLTNYGLKPSLEQLRKLGDLASSTGKGFDQLVEALADATTGQYERLKEFGIKAAKEGNKVTFTFKEQATTVDNTAQSIKSYLIGLGDLKGVSGAMAAISETLGGRISNLGDSWDGLMNTMGSQSSGTMNTVIQWLNNLVSGTDKAINKIDELNNIQGGDTTNSVLILLLKRIGLISQKSIDARIALDKLVSANGDVESSKPEPTPAPPKKDPIVLTAVEQLAAIKKVNDELEAQRILRQEGKGQTMQPMTGRYQGNGDFMLGQPTDMGGVFGNLDSHYDLIKEKREKFTAEELQGWTDFGEDLNQAIASGIGQAIESLASGLGELAAGEISGGEFGAQVLGVVGKFMQTLGGLFIAYAVQAALFSSSLAGGPMAWPLALAAGVAMIAAGAAVSSFAKKGMSGGASASAPASGYSNYSQSNATAALSGNVVFELQGTTLRGVLNNQDRKNTLIR